MKALIETYRGFDIMFDTESEKFYTVSSVDDIDQTKPSYASVKKWIDDYVKANRTFKPFEVTDSYGNCRKVVGIRKDGAFVFDNGNYSKAKHSLDCLFVKPDGYESIKANIDAIEKERRELGSKLDIEYNRMKAGKNLWELYIENGNDKN